MRKWLLLSVGVFLWTCTNDSYSDGGYPYQYYVAVRQNMSGGSLVEDLRTGEISYMYSHVGLPGDTVKVIVGGEWSHERYYRVRGYRPD